MDEQSEGPQSPAPGGGETRTGLLANIRLDLDTAARAVPGGRILLPLIVLAIGLGFGIGRPGYTTVYSESLLFIGLAISVGVFGRTFGALLVLAHGLADLARFLLIYDPTTGAQVSQETLVGRVVIEGVLWLVVVIVPSVARRVEAGVGRAVGQGFAGRFAGALTGAAAVGLGTDLWSNVMPYLLRAAYRYSPPPVTLQPQLHPELLSVAAAAAAVAVTIALRRRPVSPTELGPMIGGLPTRGVLGLLVRAVGFALLVLLVVGILSGPEDAAILAAGFLAGEIGAALAARARRSVSSIPAGVLTAGAIGLSALVALGAGAAANSAWPKGSGSSLFLPILLATALAFAVARTSLAFARGGPAGAPPIARAPAPTSVVAALALAVVLAGLVLPGHALADNCANLGDCGFSDRFVLVVSGFMAFFGAGAGAMSGGSGGGSGGDGGGGGRRGGGSSGGKQGPKPKDQPEPPPDEPYY